MQCRVKLLLMVGLVLFPVVLFALPQVAVLDAVIPDDMDPSVIVPITDKISEELVTSGKYTVLDRASVEQVLREKEFQLSSGLVKTDEIRKAGEYLGADFVVAARASKVGNTYFLSARMIDVKTGAITSQTSVEQPGDLAVLLKLARTVGNKLSGGVVEKVSEEQFAVVEVGTKPTEKPPAKKPATPREKPAGQAAAGAPGFIFGIKAGGGFSNVYGDELYTADYTPAPLFRFDAGGYLTWYLSRAAALEVGAYLAQQGWEEHWVDPDVYGDYTWFTDDVTSAYTLNYLSIPVLVKLHLGARSPLYLTAGGYMGLFMSGSYENSYAYYTFKDSTGEITEGVSGTDLGAIVGVGFDMRMGGSTVLTLDARYSFAFNSVLSESIYTSKNSMLAVLAGLGWGAGSR